MTRPYTHAQQQSMVEYSFSTLNGLESNNGPMRIKLPVLSIGQKQGSKKYYPVSFEMTDFDGTAKSGMRIDSVELEQCSENDIRMMDSRAILDNADPCVLLGNQLQITWMDNEHWRPQGSSVVLRSVWWFEVSYSFHFVAQYSHLE